MFWKKKVVEETEVNQNSQESGGEKRKFKFRKPKKKTVIFTVIGAFIAFVVISGIINSNKPMAVNVVEISSGDISQSIDTSGNVESLNKRTYFSDFEGKLGELKVSKGDAVEKGGVLFTYDEADLANKTKQAECKLTAVNGNYDNHMMVNAVNGDRLKVAELSLDIVEQQIKDWTALVDSFEYKIEEKKAALAHEGSLLQISLIDWSSNPTSEEYQNLQKLIQQNNYEQGNNKDVRTWQKGLEEAKEQLAEFKSLKAEMKGQKMSGELAVLTAGGKAEITANMESSKIDAENILNACNMAKDGIQSEFSGIVTSVDAVEGSTLAKGSQVMTVASTEDVAVKIRLTKNDLENIKLGQSVDITTGGNSYKGVVSKVNKMAEKSESGAIVVGAEVKFTNPDNNITLGLEAKVKINVGSAKGVTLVPNEVINYATEGPFVFAVKDGIVEKRFLETGMSSDLFTEVKSGIEAKELVIKVDKEDIKEGMKVKAVLQQN